MARISPSVRLVASVVVLVALIAGAVGGLIIPVYSHAAATGLETIAEEANLSSAQALVDRRQSVKLQAAQTEAEILQLANRMPERIEVPLLIVDIYELGKSCGVKLPLVSVGEPGAPGAAPDQGAAPVAAAAASSFSVVPVNLSARGSWTDIMEFHRRVRAMYRSARIKTSTITYVPAAEGTEAYINADLQLEFYLSGSATASSATTQTAPVPGTTGP